MIRYSFLYLLLILLISSCADHSATEAHLYTNQLIHTSSPYLLQHAHNPVDWHPWGEEALEKARREDKMLLISIGYAACHWCHVMEHESFEDTTVARIMNEHFVSIKVDREERPDVDAVYMTACQAVSKEGCGWPLNAFALPDGRPIWAGTYFPKKNWIEILQYFIKERDASPEKLEDYATQLTEGLRSLEKLEPTASAALNFEPEAAAQPVATFLSNFDQQYGGRKGVQKFPMPNNYEWLLQYYQRTGDEQVLAAIQLTLDKMIGGGIYDQLGGGFSRYTVDKEWKIPHFEKMLYDNAQLVSLLAKAYQMTGKKTYYRVMNETLDFIEREFTSSENGFYSSLDADSEGEEGKFYVWSEAEIDQLLSAEEARLAKRYFRISAKGNWEEGKNILHTKEDLEATAAALNMETETAGDLLNAIRKKLQTARESRSRPGLDDKILTSWNALMLVAYTDAYRAGGEEAFRQQAINNGNFISSQMLQEDFRLQRNYKDGKTAINAFLDDYAHTIAAFVALYEITFDEAWLHKAKGLADYAIAHFQDPDTGFFYYTSDLDPPLLVRKTDVNDNVIPASNSAMARALYHLGHYFYETSYRTIAEGMMQHMQAEVLNGKSADYYSNWNQLYLEMAYPFYEVAIMGPDAEQLRQGMQQQYLPHTLYLGGTNEGSIPLLKDKLVEGETYIYVCRNKVCKLPVQTVEKALELL